ncbi:hypothetical protein EK0264_06910 [Epidermidibacterium keratini]|uniref:Uncharacterized protein n=1 Tax=Epidermidibacterium keratini TaxID=1891644 RepID=A0A7L4YL94_9ACTN|nr:hypothetical protein [Epidermidibacterium keratini]QHC00031.1 hypothetical protein EK0264_06910 [Epidermidibacterium keratini]
MPDSPHQQTPAAASESRAQPPPPDGTESPTPYPVQVAARPSIWRRLGWPVIGLGACIAGLVVALILMIAGAGGPLPDDPSASDAYEQGYQDGLEDAESSYYDYGYGPGMSMDLDPLDSGSHAEILDLLIDKSEIVQLTDLCLDISFGSLNIAGSTADNPDTIEYWIYDGFESFQIDERPEINDVRFEPGQYELATYLDNSDAVADTQTRSESDLGMVCVTTEHGDPTPLAAYYFFDSFKGLYSPVVYVDLTTLAIVDD